MYGPVLGSISLLTASASLALSQAVWQENQVDTRICQWKQLRAHVIRDTVYLDGGDLLWQPGLADGSLVRPVNDDNPLGLIYTLNFSTPFNTTQNISAILGAISKTGGAANNLAPNYFDGALLGNHEEFFLYGGLTPKNSALTDPPGDTVLRYERYWYGPPRENFIPGFVSHNLGPDTTRYVAYGGAASAPSENMAWYFSGLRSASGGVIYDVGGRDQSTQAVNVSNRLITVDMARQQRETFSNVTLPPDIPGRANPELVWVPVGSRGILVVLGGVVFPDFVNITSKSSNEEASRAQSPSFMSTIDIYDVASGNWYRQNTTGGPGQLTRGCAVVAPAQDASSYNIYYYGGYDGLRQREPFNDDVWVLSLPSFTWVKLTSSDAEGRAGHKCVMPYPNQMLVIGGYPAEPASIPTCLTETIRVFDLSTGAWRDRYDPAVWSNYTVPSQVVEKIGGSGTGGATATTPSPSGWVSDELASVFATQYPASKITTYYPYASVGPSNTTNPNVTPTPVPDGGDGGVPSYLPPVLGTVLGLVFLTMVAVLVLLWRRRRLLRGAPSEAGTEDTRGNRIASWLRGQPTQPSEAKTPTVVSTEYSPSSSPDVERVAVPPQSIVEMMNTEVSLPVELPDNSPRAELYGTGLTGNRSQLGGSLNNGSFYITGTQQADHASLGSSPTPHPPPPPAPPTESPVYYRPDSEALGNAPMTSAMTSPTTTTTASPSTVRGNILSGVSNLSERDRAHLRQISDATVSSVTSAPGGDGRLFAGGTVAALEGFVESPAPVSPPIGAAGGGDYLTARLGHGPASVSTSASNESSQRRSVFTERREDMNEGKSG